MAGKVRKPKTAAVSGFKKGRPTLYTDQLGETIAASLMAGYSLTKICSVETMPDTATVYRWLAKTDHPFCDRYARAREIQAERMADELLDIADDESKDTTGELGMPNSVAVQRAKLRTDTRKWIASKLLPKKYGEKVQQEHTGEVSIKRVVVDL